MNYLKENWILSDRGKVASLYLHWSRYLLIMYISFVLVTFFVIITVNTDNSIIVRCKMPRIFPKF